MDNAAFYKFLAATPRQWLVTGAAGFIGSHLVQTLLQYGQKVIGLDNFATGSADNLHAVQSLLGEKAFSNFTFIEGDITNLATCQKAVAGAEFILHQAALGSVPRSLAEPLASHNANVNGFINMLDAAKQASIKGAPPRFVYASSSSVYGDHPALPKQEGQLGKPLSPYAATKYINEVYADVFCRAYGMTAVGLRYFNVFGPRQSPSGPYAAVIPAWAQALLTGQPVFINGHGLTSRDFCYVANAVQANLRAALLPAHAPHAVYNVACGARTTLNQLFDMLQQALRRHDAGLTASQPVYRDFRAGDVAHSLADISAIKTALGYQPEYDAQQGLAQAAAWYVQCFSPRVARDAAHH